MVTISPEVAEQIRRKKALYGRFVDTKQWEAFEQQVTLPDSQLDFNDIDGTPLVVGTTRLEFSSPGQFISFFRNFFSYLETQHALGLGDLEQIKEDEVSAIWGFEDQLIAKNTGGLVWLRGGGYYYETWKLKDGDWYLQKLRMQRTYTKTSFIATILFVLVNALGINLF